MFRDEALYIRAVLETLLKKSKIKSVLDVESSDLTFRTKVQPYIEEIIFQPLEKFGCRIYHLDAKSGEGIDIVMDATQLYTLNATFDLVLCCNLLEHVTDIPKTIIGLKKITKNGGYLLITSPLKYVYHPDPIDNFFRPDVRTLKFLFRESFTPIFSRTISINDIKIKERLLSFKFMTQKKILRFNLSHLFGKFKVTLILLKRCS
ncbi:MAG: methyltransferase domain-containing protein [Candidatus Bathyarchaeia archaeon]